MRVRIAVVLVFLLVGILAYQKVYAQVPALLWPPDGWTVDSLTPTLKWRSDGYSHLRVQKVGTAFPLIDVILPAGQDTFALQSVALLEPSGTYRWKVRNNPLMPAQSPYTWSPWSYEWVFYAPGSGSWSSIAIVQLLSPSNGAVASSVAPTLSWAYPQGAKQYYLVLAPVGKEGASISIVKPIAPSFSIPGPPAWYGMLPGVAYSWKVRVSNASGPLPLDHPSWGPWSEARVFRTPMPSSSTISSLSSSGGVAVSSLNPTLLWRNSDPSIFYYEIQVSKDPNFVTDPARATAMVYWEILHGGMTSPPNSYTIPSRYPLEPGATYYWRVRPRVEGDSAGVAWSNKWTLVAPRAP